MPYLKKQNSFQAKDIQKILGIPRQRYEYLSGKFGITPEIETVEGTGHAHSWSFKNLIEISIANAANKIGMTPAGIRHLLSFMNSSIDCTVAGIFNSDKQVDALIYCVQFQNLKYYQLDGGSFPDESKKGFIICKGFDGYESIEAIRKIGDKPIQIPGFENLLEHINTAHSLTRDTAEAYIVLNIGRIKKNVMSCL